MQPGPGLPVSGPQIRLAQCTNLQPPANSNGCQLIQPHLTEVGPTGLVSGDEGLPHPARGLQIIHHDLPIMYNQMRQHLIHLGSRRQSQIQAVAQEVIQPVSAQSRGGLLQQREMLFVQRNPANHTHAGPVPLECRCPP